MPKDPDPFAYMANQQEHTETTTCSECGTPYSATNKSRSAAKMLATGEANACARQNRLRKLEEAAEAKRQQAAEEAARKAAERDKK